MVTPATPEGPRTVRLRKWLLDLPRGFKRAILVLSDFMLLAAVVWAAVSLRYNELYLPPDASAFALLVLAPVVTISTYGWFGIYRLVTRYVGSRGVVRICLLTGLSVLIWALLVFMLGQQGIPRSVIIAYGLAASAAIVGSRQLAALLLKSVGIKLPRLPLDVERRSVLIYGAGATGVQLLEALRRNSNRDPIGFIDPTTTLWGQYVSGLKVYRPEKIGAVIERGQVREVLLAMPELTPAQRRELLNDLKSHPVDVKILPSMEEIASGKVGITDVRPVEVQDLLGRPPVPPHPELLSRSIRGKSILVTGAGGSVGSELVRQIIRQKPSRVVLLDISEVALYEIELEIADVITEMRDPTRRPEIVAVLGSVLDRQLIETTLSENQVQTIYHAAAYKHVPIVETNVFVGLENNTFGCLVIASAAEALGVERCVLISTDKAVRPTNIMGATKRLSELILQAKAAEAEAETVFTMVRFGNVLGSSGSVVRRFREQIESGGPVTVTHPDVTRYFMSIPEAAELVIQAGAMASGGEVFVLDMGEPVRIDDLARLMIKLAGFEVKDDNRPDGDIEISYTGLRLGEKLYEELLIGENTTGTEHPRILQSDEPFLSTEDLNRELEDLREAISLRDADAITRVLLRTVEGYQSSTSPGVSESQATIWVPASRTLH